MEYQKLVIKKNPRVLYKETPEAKYWKRFKVIFFFCYCLDQRLNGGWVFFKKLIKFFYKKKIQSCSHPSWLKNMVVSRRLIFHLYHHTISLSLLLHAYKFILQKHIKRKRRFHDLKTLLILDRLDKTVNWLLQAMVLV